MEHKLKTWPEFFAKVKSGEKTFELRRNDRNYKAGDILVLQEWKPKGYSSVNPNQLEGDYTGEEIKVKINYVFAGLKDGTPFGLMNDFCIMSIAQFQPSPSVNPSVERLAEEKALELYPPDLQTPNTCRSANLEDFNKYDRGIYKEGFIAGFQQAPVTLQGYTKEDMEGLLGSLLDDDIEIYDKEFYHKDDKDGDNPLSEEFLVTRYLNLHSLPSPIQQGELPKNNEVRNMFTNCMEKGCERPAVADYNGHEHFVCQLHLDSLSREFDRDYN